MDEFKGKIRLLMKARGFSQASLAKELGMSRISLCRYLCGHTDIAGSKIFKLLSILGIADVKKLVDEGLTEAYRTGLKADLPHNNDLAI